MSDTPSTNPDKRLDLWRTLRDYIVCAFHILGSPLALAELGWVRKERYDAQRNWLFRCEELFRRLLYVDALNAPAIGTRVRRQSDCRLPTAHCRPPTAFDTESPGTWRVSFQLTSSATAPSLRQKRKLSPSVDWRTTACVYPLARRFEALVRAFNAPERHVRRMARLIRKRAPQLAAQFTHPTRTYMTAKATGGDLAIADAAAFAAEAYKDSS
jgi:hypothetical protein